MICFFASPWPTGFEPTGVLTKSRFRSSGVTEWCWTNSQCSPSKSHPKYPQSLKHLQKLSETQILEELFHSNSSHKNHHLLFFLLHLGPTGFEPTGVLTKSRFRSSGVTEWCWTNSQCSPSKSHPKYPQSLKHLQKLISETQILEELFYSNSSHKTSSFVVFFASPWPTGFEPTGVLTKSRFRSSGVTEWCWTNSQYSPSKSHHKKSTIIETSSKSNFFPDFGRVVSFKFFT